MKLYYPITVDLYQPYPLPIMEAQQNNIGRGVLVTLTAQGAVITPDGESIQMYAKKPDGTISYLACTLAGSQIQCDFTNQMLALPGMVQVELQMIGGESGAETEITTPIFCVKVNPSNVDDSAVESQDEFPALVTALAEVEDLKKNGLKGDAATVTVGSTTTGDPGTDAAVSNSGTTGDAVLNFTIPRGADGSMWYYGDAITGNSTSGTVFAESGITSANMGDKYLNTSSGADKGNVYTCTVAGDAETAQWVYIGNIEGPQGPEGPAGMQEITFAARSAFPESGQENMLYIDNTLSPAVLYLFNTGLNQYVPINQGSVEFTGSGTTILMQSQQAPKSFRSLEVYGKSTQNGTPSPESPAPIETAGSDGTVDVNLTGANLFDASKLPTKSAGGATVTNNGDGSFTVSGSANISGMFASSYNYSHEETILLLKPGVLKANFGKLTSPKCFFQIVTSSGIAVDLNNGKVVSVEGKITRDLLSDPSSQIRISFYTASGSIVSGITKPMVYQEGDGTWEPYKEPQSLPISVPNGLSGIPVESGGNYTDETGQQWIADVKDYGTEKYTQNCATVVFDGSEDEDWEIDDSYPIKRYSLKLQDEAKVSDTTTGATSMNSNLPLGRKGGTYAFPNIYTISDSGVFYVSLNGTESLSEFKQYLQQNPMTLLYQLSTPIVTDISAEEMEAYKALKTYTPTTVISSDSGVWMEADLVDSDILYPHAENTSYDNSTSGLTSDNVQAAIDENAEAIRALNSRTPTLKRANVEAEFTNGAAVIPFSSIGIDTTPDFAMVQSLYSSSLGAHADSFTVQFAASTINVYGRTENDQQISGNRILGILMWFDS